MSKTIRIRNVPEDLYRRFEMRAAEAGRTLSDYLLDVLRRLGEEPTLAELRHRIAGRERVSLAEPAAESIRAERERRERDFD